MKQKIKVIFSACSAFFLAGCTSLSVFVANIPTYFDEVRTYKNVVYQEGYNLALDVYIPPSSIPVKSQSIVFFYGGSWEDGSKDQYKFLGSALAQKGYVVFIPDYRKYPDVKFPEFMIDAADAVKWIVQHKKDYELTHSSFILMGHSAGANIATLLITDKSYLDQDYKNISGGVGLSGAYDFTPNTDNLKDIFGPPEKYPLMRPITFVDGNEPPMFLGYGLKDEVVARFNFDHMVEKLHANQVCLVAKEYPSLDHVKTIGEFSWVGDKNDGIVKDVTNFLNSLEAHTSCAKKS